MRDQYMPKPKLKFYVMLKVKFFPVSFTSFVDPTDDERTIKVSAEKVQL